MTTDQLIRLVLGLVAAAILIWILIVIVGEITEEDAATLIDRVVAAAVTPMDVARRWR